MQRQEQRLVAVRNPNTGAGTGLCLEIRDLAVFLGAGLALLVCGIKLAREFRTIEPAVQVRELIAQLNDRSLLATNSRGQDWKSFVDTGLALSQIREKELYVEFGTFEEYCRTRWNFAHSKANYLIKAAGAFSSIVAIPDVPRPDHEFTLRPLLHLPPPEVQRVWTTAAERMGGRKITARVVRNVSLEERAGVRGIVDCL